MGSSRMRWAVAAGLAAALAVGAEQADEPGHAVRQVPIGVLFGEVYTQTVVPGQWESVRDRDRRMWWVYRTGGRVRWRGGDARYRV